MPSLIELGWTPELQGALSGLEDSTLKPYRVAEVHGASYRLLNEEGEFDGVLAGRLRHQAAEALDLPAVGDWVAAHHTQPVRILERLPRRGALVRQAAGERTQAQVLAANVDWVLVVSAVGREFNVRRIERFLAAIHGSHAMPGLVLNKCDALEEVAPLMESLQALSPDSPVLGVSALTGQGMEGLFELLYPGCTVALVGSSGVGKSTLINRLLGEERLSTGAVRSKDERGRHTTSSRQLVPMPLPGGGWALLMDTPGLRELQLWADGASVEAAFPEVARLADGCHYADCTHQHEPGCAVREAVERGELSPEVVDSLHKLQREQRHQARRQDVHARLEGKRREKMAGRLLRQFEQLHPKRRR